MTVMLKGGRTAEEEAAYQERVAQFPPNAHRDVQMASRLGLKQCWVCAVPRFVHPRKFSQGEVVLCPEHFQAALDAPSCASTVMMEHWFAHAAATATSEAVDSVYCARCLAQRGAT